MEISALCYRVLQELCTSVGWSLCLQSARSPFHQRRRELCNVLAPCQFFYLWHGRSTNRKGKICRVKSLDLFLFSFELAFTSISGITPSSQCISGKENQCLKSSYTLICACFHKRLVLDILWVSFMHHQIMQLIG